MLRPPVAIPTALEKTYLIARGLLWFFTLLVGSILLLALLFPDFTASFNFRNPNSSRNTLLDPRLSDDTPRPNGKINSEQTLTLTAPVLGDFGVADIEARLENKSALPESVLVTLSRAYRAFLFPIGSSIDRFPTEDLYRIGDTYYALRNDTLFPFVSEQAYLSRYPKDFAKNETPDFLRRFTVNETFLGFRVGSLLSFADGVFIVTSETDIRPVGSAQIFLGLGYNFEDVLPVSEEDIGIYKRGRILLLGAIHPDGTLFRESETDMYFIIEGRTKRAITDKAYRDFLVAQQIPIVASERTGKITENCTLRGGTLFPRNFSCTTPIESLRTLSGSDYILTLSNPATEIDINTLTLTLETRKNGENIIAFLAQIKQRLLNRFGYGNE